MSTPSKLFEKNQKRKNRVRAALKKAANGKMRLSVFRSGKHIYAQIIDDTKGVTVASASTLDKEIRDSIKKSSTIEAASFIGKTVADAQNTQCIGLYGQREIGGLRLCLHDHSQQQP